MITLDFEKLRQIADTGQNVIPVVVQHATTKDVLVIAYTNDLALEETQKTGIATFWSTSRNELWVKGNTSGNYLKLVEIRVNCEENSLLYLVEPLGHGVCHVLNPETGQHWDTCFYRSLFL